MSHDQASFERTSGGCPFSGKFTTGNRSEIMDLLRSKAISNSPEVNVGNHEKPSELGDLTRREFVDGILAFSDGDAHRTRRKVLNTLVRPRALDAIREHIVAPAVRREMKSLIVESAVPGQFECDLAALVERVFLEFSARMIGFQGLESDDAITDLRTCVLPIFTGLISNHFEDRAAVMERAMAAKRKYIKTYYEPALEFHRRLYARYESGEIGESELPTNLMRLIVGGAHPSYADEELAIRESMLFFSAATGTSTQAILSTVDYLSQWFEDHPGDRAFATDLEFLSNALQESLRLRAPYISYLTRLAIDDIELDGGVVRKGQEVRLQVPAAGRDPEVYGDDAHLFNPRREVAEGITRYGVGFSGGPHACLGLRIVLGNDGRGGSHVSVLRALFAAGVRPDLSKKRDILEMRETADAVVDIPTYRTFPATFTNWRSPAADAAE